MNFPDGVTLDSTYVLAAEIAGISVHREFLKEHHGAEKTGRLPHNSNNWTGSAHRLFASGPVDVKDSL